MTPLAHRSQLLRQAAHALDLGRQEFSDKLLHFYLDAADEFPDCLCAIDTAPDGRLVAYVALPGVAG